jgi:RNA polymerase sigma-70 factor (ECF subfamily)
MSEDQEFLQLLQRVRQGEPEAATELVHRYEPEIRRAVRIRLTDPRLRQVLDSMDVCQSVLANFFMRAAAGQFDLKEPQELLRLLATMAHNKVVDLARRQKAKRRDRRRIEPGQVDAIDVVADSAASPSRIVAGRDLLDEVRRRLSNDERYLADQRALGRDWPDLAAELGGTADGHRKKLIRALDRVSRGLGLEADDYV